MLIKMVNTELRFFNKGFTNILIKFRDGVLRPILKCRFNGNENYCEVLAVRKFLLSHYRLAYN